jgi:hypothetical protein
MGNAVLPDAVLAPGVTVVRANDDVRAAEALEQRAELAVDELEARTLTAATPLRVVVVLERAARARLGLTVGALMVVRHVRLADGIERDEEDRRRIDRSSLMHFRHGPVHHA